MKAIQKRKRAKMKLAPDPAIRVKNLAFLEEAAKPPGTVGSSSPAGRTKPPTGIQLSE
jgi:hypothetical protein